MWPKFGSLHNSKKKKSVSDARENQLPNELKVFRLYTNLLRVTYCKFYFCVTIKKVEKVEEEVNNPSQLFPNYWSIKIEMIIVCFVEGKKW